LRRELELISSDDVQGLEDSMPAKYRILGEIQKLRQDAAVPEVEPTAAEASRLRALQQRLVMSWREASGLNEIAKDMVTKRLKDLDRAVQSCLSALKDGYAKDGKRHGVSHHTLRTGA